MAYGKLPLVVQDFFLGIQQVNGAIENGDALQAAYAAEHRAGAADGGPQTGVPLPAGRHDDVLIPRTVVQVVVSSTTYAGGTTPNYTVGLYGAPYLQAIDRIATGLWFVRTRHLAVDPWAEVEAVTTAVGTFRLVKAEWQADFMGKAGFLVQGQAQPSSGAAFAPADFSFDLRIYSR